MTCADIRVLGATGVDSSGNTKNFQTAFIDQDGCQRVNDYTHWTPIFMPLVTANSDGTNAAFTESGMNSSHSTTRTMLFVTVFAVAWCLVVSVWMCFCRAKRQRRRSTEIERKRMTATVEESHKIAGADIEMGTEMERDYELETIDVTKSSPSV